MKKLILFVIVFVALAAIILLINRSLPYDDREELLSANISVDSVYTLGVAAAFYDSASNQFYWLKSYTSFDQSKMDTLKNKKAHIRYMKFFKGPLENRVFRMEVDSVVVFDQVIERD